MKKITTNITFWKILFILLVFVFASFIFFSLGVRFGPQVLNIARTQTNIEVKRDGDNFQISKTEINKALSNIGKLYTDIRAVPRFKNGKVQGFKLLTVKPRSLFQKLGLRRGDILVSVNGRVLDIQSGLETFTILKNKTEFKLQVERRGDKKIFSYQITE